MSDIVWAIKSESDSFENVLQRMNQFASEILDAKNIALNFTSDPALSAARLKMKQRKNLYLFFKEAINNAAKHSGAKMVSVRIFKKEGCIELIVSDDGKGFDSTNHSLNGNGMSSMKKRAEELNGNYNIQHHLNEGTEISLKFKIT
jgi:signal transduction histidine kinase